MECTECAALAAGPGFTWHMTEEMLLLGEGSMIFSTSSCPSLIPLSPFPASSPDAGLLPATLLADEDLVCPVSHSSYRSPGFFFFFFHQKAPLQLHGHLHVLSSRSPALSTSSGHKPHTLQEEPSRKEWAGLSLFPWGTIPQKKGAVLAQSREQALRVPSAGCACPAGSGP